MDEFSSSRVQFRREKDLKSLGIFRTIDTIRVGVSQRTVSRMAQAGILDRLEHGIFMHKDFERPEHAEFIVACLRVGPESVVGALTALAYYSITEQVSSQTWVMVPNSNRGTYPKNYRILRTKHDPSVEITDNRTWRIVTIERAIIEAFAYSTKIGYQTALAAARTALAEEKATDDKLHRAAKALGLWPLMIKYWEAIVAK